MSGYDIRQRDLDFLGLTDDDMQAWMARFAPLGMSRDEYLDWRGSLLEALARDGVDLDTVDIRLRGSCADFFSGPHKQLPTEDDLADNPEALERLRSWLGDDLDRPVGRPVDSMYRLGLDEPSDFDLNLSSREMFERARARWDPDKFGDTLIVDHGYLDKELVRAVFPHLHRWAREWSARTGRDMSYAIFDEGGPADVSHLGFMVHFQDTDWVVHRAPTSTVTLPPTDLVPTTLDRESGAAADPAATAERAWSERFGHDIITDEGRVTDSQLAKGTVIREVTSRMTVSTEALLAAGQADHVDPTAAAHLGNREFAIVLNNPNHPSMGGTLVERSELDSAPWDSPAVLGLDAPHAEQILREMAVSELIMAWAHNSNGGNVRSLAIQEAAAIEFQLDAPADWTMSDMLSEAVQREVDAHGAVHRELLRVQYEHTQEVLAGVGVNHLVLYRSVHWTTSEAPPWAFEPEHSTIDMPAQRPLSAWTTHRATATDWMAGLNDHRVLLASRFPSEQLLAFARSGIGCLWQYEFVVIGGPGFTTLDGTWPEEIR